MRFFTLTALLTLAVSYGVQATPAPQVSVAPGSGGVCLPEGASCVDTEIRCCSPYFCSDVLGGAGVSLCFAY
jgi:hypothetical protein